MGRFAKGEVVVIPFPFTDSANWKPRPALVIAQLTGNDSILCAIMTPRRQDSYSISLTDSDFESGQIDHNSIIRPNRIMTGDDRRIIKSVGRLSADKIREVVQKLVQIIQN